MVAAVIPVSIPCRRLRPRSVPVRRRYNDRWFRQRCFLRPRRQSDKSDSHVLLSPEAVFISSLMTDCKRATMSGYGCGPTVRTDDVIRIRGMAAPVSDGFVRGIFQSHIARSDRNDCRSQHFHLFYIDVLAFYIRFAHVAMHSMFIRAQTVAVATPCCPAPVSAMIRFLHASCQ